MTKVLLLKGDSYKAVESMFMAHGYDVVYSIDGPVDPSLIVFTGGSDVSPYIYGEEPDGARGCDPVRDEFEKSVYEAYVGRVPMIGICRGGQLLNVLNGGKMIQHLGSTISGDVMMGFPAIEYDDLWNYPPDLEVRVDHHQGMISGEDGEPLSWNENHEDWPDYSIWYPDTKSLCFQPHPEWGHKPTEEYFFELVDKYIPKGD